MSDTQKQYGESGNKRKSLVWHQDIQYTASRYRNRKSGFRRRNKKKQHDADAGIRIHSTVKKGDYTGNNDYRREETDEHHHDEYRE